MSRRAKKIAYVRAINDYVEAEKKRKKTLYVLDTILKIAAGAMLIAALYVIHGM